MTTKRMAVSGQGSFDHRTQTRLVYAPGAIESIGMLCREFVDSGGRILLVTDPGLVKAGHASRVRGLLQDSGYTVSVFDQVKENPSSLDVDVCKAHADEFGGVDLLVGLGGGSSLDTARGCNFLLTNGGQMEDYWGYAKAKKPMLPMIAVPTTSGTGSECQTFALISHRDTHVKMACGDPKAGARVAILDPCLTTTQPREVTANTGVDALVHAVETAVTKPRNPLSLLYSHEAFSLIHSNLEAVLQDPNNEEARGNMQLGAAFAGLSIENSMLGAAHSAANPLTSRFNVVHGPAVAVMVPRVMAYNSEDKQACEAYAVLARKCLIADRMATDEDASLALRLRVADLIGAAGISLDLKDHGVDGGQISVLAEDAAKQWTAQFNPREVDAGAFTKLYQAAMSSNI
jgi:alcohol dehydrogenase